MPESIAPMQATLAARPPAGDGWIYEIKWDGVRALCFVESGTLRILSRNGNRCELQYPELTVLPHYLRAEQAILDGEIVVLDERGVSRFELIQQRIGAADAAGIARMARSRPATLYLFDLIYLDGYDLRKVELAGRKRALAAVAAPGERVRLSEHFTGGEELLEAAAEMGLEGIVAKRLDSGYQSRRGREWLKVKLVTEEEFLICGFTQGERDYFGALVLGARREGGLIWVGNAGTGFSEAMMRDLYGRLDSLITPRSPFTPAPRIPRVTWVEPRLAAEIRFASWTGEGRLRAPVFLRLKGQT